MKKYDWMKFWLRVIAVAMLLFVFFDIAATAKAEEFVITGYGPGEFAIKGEVERQSEQLVYKLGRIQQSGYGLEIKVVGSADIAGRSVTNDQLAKVRAEQIAAYLTTALAVFETRVVSWSQGDQANVRRVKVIYTITSAPAAQEKPKGGQALYLLSLSLGIAVVAVMLFVLAGLILRMNRQKRTEAQATIENPQLNKFPKTTLSKKPIPLTFRGHDYDFYPEIAQDGRLKTFYQIEPGRFMFVPDEDRLKSSLKTSLKDQSLLDSLLKQGRMRMRIS